ncbi:unnamed protein product [Prorocentrum cordatum]|uniref:Myosin motor domain-containing protein n=1 Tax=Prorocentrum cordatum TaxID=2364126 RepID=A0ABN9SW20_9DINO|nr:unnamed protein product [Polarella glacialis]
MVMRRVWQPPQDGIWLDKIIQTNPVLESFGNAMTVRNNNSSRFGKWVEIGVSQRLSIKGCSVTDYGLELTRDSYVPGSFAYLRDSLFQAPGVSDEKNFQELQQGFDALGFTANTQTEVFRIVIGILTLGNVEFQDGDGGATVPSEGPSAKAAELFCVDAEELRRSIVVRKINVAGDITETYRDPPKARSARDALARLLYGRLFKWLIAKINVTLSTGDGAVESDAFFGILDIAGFEMLEQNSLEQVFINLSNEFLQRFFNISTRWRVFLQKRAGQLCRGGDRSQFRHYLRG